MSSCTLWTMKTHCKHCSAELTARGTPPKSGVWFCKARDCRAAKARHDRRVRNDIDPSRMETRPCSNCGNELPSRSWRVTDIEEGRWCRNGACQAIRHRVLTTRNQSVDSSQVFNEMFINARKRGWVHCHDCGQEYGVEGFPHPTPEGAFCFAFGELPVEQSAAEWTWPEVLVSDPTRRKQMLMTLRANGLRPDEVIPSD